MNVRFISISILLSALSLVGWSEPFEPVVIDGALKGAYQAVFADINNDGKFDVAALGEGDSGVYWYENPSWKRRPICEEGLSRFIDLAFHDLDGDGELEVAVASGFSLNSKQSTGVVSWLDRQSDIDLPWTIHPIFSEPTAHRVRWADTNGDGAKELIVAPITGVGSSGPDFRQTGVRLLSFSIPKKLDSVKEWPFDLIDDGLHLLHGLTVVNDVDRDRLLTASLEGVCLLDRTKEGRWILWRISAGSQEEGKLTGCSEVAEGKMKDGQKFFASIEPWHGNQVVLYRPPALDNPDSNALTERTVIDDSFDAGHALACADFDGDGGDEVIAGYRGKGHSIYLYRNLGGSAKDWTRTLISESIAAQGFAVGDVDGDGKPDFAATGGSTHNVVLFLNRMK